MSDKLNRFNYCKNIDLHVSQPDVDFGNVLAVAAEHGFRSIVVPPAMIRNINRTKSRLLFKNAGGIKIITSIDAPYGLSPTEVRAFSIKHAKAEHASEVEVHCSAYNVIPNMFLQSKIDMTELLEESKRSNILLRYVINYNAYPAIDTSVISRMIRVLADIGIQHVGIVFDKYKTHQDNILTLRSIASKSNLVLKTLVNTASPEEFGMYPKAGAKIIGLDWQQAPYIAHAYEHMVENTE